MENKISKNVLSVLLTLSIFSSAFILPTSATEIESTTKTEKEVTAGTGSSDSEYVEPEYEQTDYMTEQQYQDLGFSSLEDPSLFDESDTSNPLEGYEASILSELYMGRGGYGADYTADAHLMENAATYDDLDLNSFENRTLARNSKYPHDANDGGDWNYQSSTTATIKLGDLSGSDYIPDSIIYNSMFVKNNGSYQVLDLYTYNSENDRMELQSESDIFTLDSNDKFVQDLEVQEASGYQAITVGDFDNDNYNEVAVYRSVTGNPKIAIYEQAVYNGKTILVYDNNQDISLSAISTHFVNTDGRNRPLVNLSTTNIAGRDDLVINVSLPWNNDGKFCHGGCTAIYSWSNTTSQMVYKDYMERSDYRMKFTASATMDIDGDGSKELIVASNKNSNFKDGSSRGDISENENLVNVVLWSENENKYYNAWSEPQTIEALDFIKKGKDRKSPVAVTGARFSSTGTMETLFVEGVFYTFKQGAGDIPEERITNGKFVTSSKFDKSSGGNNPFIHLAISASFVEEDRLSEQVLVVYGDENGANSDQVCLDLFWCYNNGTEIEINCTDNNYYHNKNEDDNGTFLTFCSVDVDMDTVYMEYINKTVGWSNPAVHSVMLSAPYWSELDYGTAMTARGSTTYKIETGTTDSLNVDANFGVGLSIVFDTKVSVFGNGGKLGFSVDIAGNYIYKYQTAHTIKEVLTFTSGAGEDYVALIVVPIVTYHYKTWVPEHKVTQEDVDKYIMANGEEGCPKVGDIVEGQYTDMCVNVQLNPANSTVPVSTYNKVIEEFNRTEDEKFHLPTVDIENLYAGRVAGDPSTYASNVSEISSADPDDGNTLTAENWASIGVNKKSTTSLDLGEGQSSTQTHGFNFSLKGGISETFQWGMNVCEIFVAEQTLKFTETVQLGAGCSWAYSNSNNITYSTTFASLPDSAQTGTSSAGTPISSYSFNSKIVKWSPEDISSATIKTVDGEDLITDTCVIGCIVQGIAGAPPSLPSNFHVSSTTNNTATLRWNNSSNNGRKPADYMLYYSKSASGDYFPFVDTNGKNAVISADDEFYTVQGLAENTTYYFKLKAFYNANNSDTASVLGPYASGKTKGDSAEPKITKPPVDLYKGIGDKPIFTIEVTPSNPENTLIYKWQQLVQTEYLAEWKDISESEVTSSSFNAAYYAENGVINSANVKALDKTVYRCIVTEREKNGNNYCSVISRSAALYTTLEHEHIYNKDGFCIYCENYQPATLNCNGAYEISTTGQLFWFASLVNGDSTHAVFDEQNTNAKGVLVADINLEDREWTSVKNFNGTFDGQNHTISGLNITSGSSDIGLFGNVLGGTIKDLTVKGKINLNSDCNRIGGVVGHIDGGTISNVSSYVDISNSNGVPKHIGGVIGTVEKNKTIIEKCTYYGSINVSNSTDCFGGIVAYTNSGARINNCANYGTISTSNAGAYTGGILAYMNNTSASVQNSYNYGKVSNAGNTNHCGAVVGFAKNYGSNKIANNYYLDSSSSLAFGSDSKSGLFATSKTAEEFKSGNVAYLLNNKVTDGTQMWYQNIDNGKTSDDYPVFEGGTVYYLAYKDAYSNTYSKNPEPNAFDKDENGNLIIKTYDDLVDLAKLIKSDYEVYGLQNYILQNNIVAPSDYEWTQGIGSISDNNPFNGTFDGNGYCIIGLNVNSSEYGGLFEIIGENGCVKDLIVFDCNFAVSSDIAGGIAAVNNGTIDHCVSGVNFTTGTVHINSTTIINAVSLNSDIKGEISGGIVGENNGLVTGCRNASVVSGTQCGGITGVNTGKIYGCANNAKIGTSSSSISGGLVGKNGGKIESSYNSGTVKGSSERTIGSIVGLNGYDSTETSIVNVFHSTANGVKAVGTDSATTPDETNKGMSKNFDFISSDFVDELNAVSDDTVVWVQDSVLNKGYPTIKGNFLKYSVKSAGNNITVEGNMHESLNIKYTLCSKGSTEYNSVASLLSGRNILSVYSASLTDNEGNYIPAELWCQGDLKISVPVDSKNVQFAGVDAHGQITYYAPDSVENGIAKFTVAEPVSFAVVDNNQVYIDSSKQSDNNESISSDNSNAPINTGDTTCFIIMLIALIISFAFIISLRRRDNIG